MEPIRPILLLVVDAKAKTIHIRCLCGNLVGPIRNLGNLGAFHPVLCVYCRPGFAAVSASALTNAIH